MTKAQKHKHIARGLRGVFYGWSPLGGTTKATLYVGSKTGLSIGPVPEGKQIPQGALIETVIGIRAGQIGPAAGATATVAKGRYKGQPETSYKIEFFPDEPLPKFKKNIRQLAERAARDLGQREIFVEMIEGGKRTSTYSASPSGAPKPTDRNAFCSWVRANSKAAKRPGDDCYRSPKQPSKKQRKP